MCGICGKVAFDRDESVDPALIASMMVTLRHRGPDGQGSYVRGNVGLGHTRLSIIDLESGEQPISNEDGQVVVVFNGEIYNFKDLRQDLLSRGHRFRTTSDTEVIVHAYEEYGDRCVEKLLGMFAFALWDARRQRLLLARDRVGIKPLYYAATRRALVFGSEIKSLIQDDSLGRDVNLPGLDSFLAVTYMPGRETLLRGVFKLEPGHLLTLQDGSMRTTCYWDLEFPQEPARRDLSAATADLQVLLRQSVRDHMISDVPVGILLSGGVDSTAILAMATDAASDPLHTFTIGFESQGLVDERHDAREVAHRFGARHHETTISAEQFKNFIEHYVWHMEEPVCEPPAIALYYVSKLASEHVKVLLSGEGGDEAFAGYSNYRNILWLERFKQFSPTSGVLAAARATSLLGRIPRFSGVAKYTHALKTPLSRYYMSRTSAPGSVSRDKSALCTAEFLSGLNGNGVASEFTELFAKVRQCDPLSQMLYVDTKTWLPGDLLIKADKVTMANSVELRVPLLDHRVLEFAASLPANFKVRGLTTKFILKRALIGVVPRHILDKKKTGFPVPYASWMRNELRTYVTDLLTDSRTVSRGYFRQGRVESLIARLVNGSGGTGTAHELFGLMILELWHRAFIDEKPSGRRDCLQASALRR